MLNDLTETPSHKAPPSACDSHLHVFGPVDRYPPDAGLRYSLPHAPYDDYKRLAGHLGIERMVIVQPSAYGRDNRCMLDVMSTIGAERCRGIVDIDADITDGELARMDTLGVRGVRINTSPNMPYRSGYLEALLPRIERLDARCAELGWHLDFLGPGWLTTALIPTLRKLKVNYSIAHMGMYLAQDGVRQSGLQSFIDLLKNGDGSCWVKFTGIYRISKAPGFADVAPLARALIEVAPDRIIWGSDYPHISFADQVTSVALFSLLADWAPDPGTRTAILADNPRRLFGF